MFEQLLRHPNIEIMLDCGAHTIFNSKDAQPITVEDYCEFVKEYESELGSYVAFDVINDPVATRRNLATMLDKGLRPMPIHVLGDDGERMDELFKLSDKVALGGCLRNAEYQLKRAFVYSYIAKKMEWAKGRPVHWFGFTRREFVPSLRPHSCDSRTWASGSIFAQLGVYLGNGKWETGYQYEGRGTIRSNPKAMQLCRQVKPCFNIDDKQEWTAKATAQGGVSRINTDSWVRYAIDIYKMFGTTMYLAAAPSNQAAAPLIAAIERNAWRLGKG